MQIICSVNFISFQSKTQNLQVKQFQGKCLAHLSRLFLRRNREHALDINTQTSYILISENELNELIPSSLSIITLEL